MGDSMAGTYKHTLEEMQRAEKRVRLLLEILLDGR